jgi:spore coat polysaccharide biosynthesis protein SpsF
MSKKKIVSTIEARMTSSRLPGKVLMEASGMPLLEILVKRLKKVSQIDCHSDHGK